jgi:hypothetical protein
MFFQYNGYKAKEIREVRIFEDMEMKYAIEMERAAFCIRKEWLST